MATEVNIDIRQSWPPYPYVGVTVQIEAATFDLGLHNEKARKALAVVFLDAAAELLEGLEDQE